METYVQREAAASRASSFMSMVYGWMLAGLAITAVCGAWASSEAALAWFAQNMWAFFALVIGELVLVGVLTFALPKMSSAAATLSFCGYSAMSGVTLGPLLATYTQSSVLGVFLATSLMFGGLAAYGAATKRDLTGLGAFCGMGLFGVLIAMLVNLFIGSEMTSWVISICCVVVFTGLTAYDAQKIRNLALTAPDDDVAIRRMAIFGALQLYLDFINIFIHLLRIFGERR